MTKATERTYTEDRPLPIDLPPEFPIEADRQCRCSRMLAYAAGFLVGLAAGLLLA